MAELGAAVGLAASVVQLADVAFRISRKLFGSFADVKDAPQDIDRLKAALNDMMSVTHNVSLFCQEFQSSNAITVENDKLPVFIRDLRGCISELDMLESEILKIGNSTANRVGKARRNLLWAYDKHKILASQRRLEAHKSSLQIALTTLCA
jgi:hypothetical protein